MSTIIDRIRQHLNNKDSSHHRILIGFLWVSAFVFIGKMAGAGKEIIIAWRYGISSTVDAYVFTLTFVSLPVGIWFSVLSSVLVPLLIQLRQDSPNELVKFRSEVFGLTLLIGCCVSLIIYFGLFWFIESGNSGLPKATAALTLEMLPILSLIIPFGFAIGLFSTLLLSVEKHRNTLLESVPALVIIIALLLPPGIIPEPLIWGTVVGFALHMATLAAPLSYSGEIGKPILSFRSPEWQRFWFSIGIVAIGQTLMSLTTLIDQIFLAKLTGGSIAAFGYANRLVSVLLGFGALTIARSSLPVLSKNIDEHTVHNIIKTWSIGVFLFGTIISAIFFIYSDNIIKLVFEHGEFTSKNTQIVASIFNILIIQIPFYFLGTLNIQYLFAKHKKKYYIFSCLIALAIKLLTVILFILMKNLTTITIAISTLTFIISWSASTYFFSKTDSLNK